MTDNIRETAAKIAGLNDLLRKGGFGGTVYLTSGVRRRGEAFVADAIRAVRTFSDFTPENDPHGEHDFGTVLVAERLPMKINAAFAGHLRIANAVWHATGVRVRRFPITVEQLI